MKERAARSCDFIVVTIVSDDDNDARDDCLNVNTSDLRSTTPRLFPTLFRLVLPTPATFFPFPFRFYPGPSERKKETTRRARRRILLLFPPPPLLSSSFFFFVVVELP